MKKQNITKTLTSLAALSLTAALMLTFPGCQTSRTSGQPDTTPQDTTPRNTTPQDTEAPPTTEPEVTWKPVETTIAPVDLLTPMPTETEPEVTTPASPTEAQVIRAHDISQSALENLMARHPGSSLISGSLPLVHLTDRAALDDFLKEAGSQTLKDACEGYDESFFQDNDLIIVPRVTTTGSARHTVELATEDQILSVKITVTTPEIVTMDMANWFLVIPAAKTDTQGRTPVATIAGVPGGIGVPTPGNPVRKYRLR